MQKISKNVAKKLFNKGELITIVKHGVSLQSMVSRHASKNIFETFEGAVEDYSYYFKSKKLDYYVGSSIEIN